jgi:hypothetical protein
MGMYDYITCKAPLPLTEELSSLEVNWTDVGFQTKCLDNDLAHYIINDDGYLYIEKVDREYVQYTPEELKSIKPKPWSLFKDVIIKSKTLEKVEHHGSVDFYDILNYTDTEDLWVEFKACFIYGKLDKIDLVETKKMRSNKLNMLEFEAAQRIREAKPWYRFKRLVGPYGWRRSWLFLAKLLTKTSDIFAKMQTLIYKHMI